MEEGLRKLLTMHTANELSSICGQLGLKILQKASTSIEQIMNFVTKDHIDCLVTPEMAETVVNFMWEFPIKEYLHSLGIPATSYSSIHPKKALIQLWVDGGMFFTGNNDTSNFTPYYMKREIKKRYKLSMFSDDIVLKLDKIRLQQERAKRAEETLRFAGELRYDYTLVVAYLKETYELRKMENSLREVLVTELDTTRSQKDSCVELVSTLEEQLKECEEQFTKVTGDVNQKLVSLFLHFYIYRFIRCIVLYLF